MRSYRVLITIALLVAVASVAAAEPRTDGALAGRVIAAERPLSTARVYAYEMAGSELRRVTTDLEGVFLFDALPAGLYKIITLKQGFLPAVVMLTRASAEATQFLEVELDQEPRDQEVARASFWKIREAIPSDILRDLELPTAVADGGSVPPADDVSFTTEMRAVAGTHEGFDVADAQVNGASVGIEGQIRDLSIGFEGQFSEIASQRLTDGSRPGGSLQALSLQVEAGSRSRVDVASSSNQLVTASNDLGSDIGFENHHLSWTQAIGDNGRSDFSAQYTEENNYYRQALIHPGWIPQASRSWQFAGSYSTRLSRRSTLEAGVRYRERESQYGNLTEGLPLLPRESVEIFGRGGVEVNPTIVVQYGLYSTLRDGSLSLAPQGGLLLKLGQNWRASTVASRRLDQDDYRTHLTGFTPSYVEDPRLCRNAEVYCYGVELSRSLGGTELLSVGAVHRKIGETQRLFFDGDFLDRLDSLYLVEGDELPEIRMELTRRIAPEIVARVRSYIAAGGGGLMRNGSDSTFENEVRYLVTSFDTQFEETSTGVFVAFHRLEQELNPIADDYAAPALALERLQLGVSQDFDFLRHLATDLALHVKMELSRGTTSEAPVLVLDDLHRRVTGGLAVRF